MEGDSYKILHEKCILQVIFHSQVISLIGTQKMSLTSPWNMPIYIICAYHRKF